MIPPRGFKAELFPLQHKLAYSFGLTAGTAATNSSIMSIVKNYKSVNNPDTINVNPHHASFATEGGAICAPMSIIEKVSIDMSFNLTEDALADGIESINVNYMPIFNSFVGRLDSADDKTTTTAAALLELTKDSTEEDITPAFATKLTDGAAANSLVHATSSTNFTEVFGTMNLTTNTTMEGVPWFNNLFFNGLKYYTNKGALRSMVGKMRRLTLSKNRPNKRVFIRNFVPRDVRRIVPYSYFGMLIHVPLDNEIDQLYQTGAVTADKVAVGVKTLIKYHEWNADHLQEMM